MDICLRVGILVLRLARFVVVDWCLVFGFVLLRRDWLRYGIICSLVCRCLCGVWAVLWVLDVCAREF